MAHKNIHIYICDKCGKDISKDTIFTVTCHKYKPDNSSYCGINLERHLKDIIFCEDCYNQSGLNLLGMEYVNMDRPIRYSI